MNYIVRIYDGAAVSSTKVYAGTFTIAVTNSATGAVGSVTAAATSTAVMTKTGTGEGTDETDLSAVMTPTGAAIANIAVTQKTAAGLPSRESVTVTTSIGNLADAATLAGSTVSGKTLTLESASNGVNTVYLFADGTSGRAAITIKTTSVTFSAKSAVFYSTTVAKIDVTQLGTTLGGTAANVILAKAYDASGNQIIDNTSVYAYSSNLDAINTGAATGTACSYVATSAGQVCSLTGSTDGAATFSASNVGSSAISASQSQCFSPIHSQPKPAG
jgi:hypothetical protein